MHDTLFLSHKGFYCNVCDARMTKYFNVKHKEIIVHEDQCRDLMTDSLMPMIYLHYYMTRYLNIVTKFMTQCNTSQQFNDKPINPKNLFFTHENIRKKLMNCHEHRNSVDWLDYCSKICSEFKIDHFNSDFFAPKIKKYADYNWFLKD